MPKRETAREIAERKLRELHDHDWRARLLRLKPVTIEIDWVEGKRRVVKKALDLKPGPDGTMRWERRVRGAVS